jgi:hypothetical protein
MNMSWRILIETINRNRDRIAEAIANPFEIQEGCAALTAAGACGARVQAGTVFSSHLRFENQRCAASVTLCTFPLFLHAFYEVV